jgi:hypothetical protein
MGFLIKLVESTKGAKNDWATAKAVLKFSASILTIGV